MQVFFYIGKSEYLKNIESIGKDTTNAFYKLIPAIVNLSFALELAFKTLINQEDIDWKKVTIYRTYMIRLM